jgi:hypothetical protein
LVGLAKPISSLIYSHNDFPMAVRELLFNDISGLNFNSNLSESEPWASYDLDHTDLPRLRAGKVGGQVRSHNTCISC